MKYVCIDNTGLESLLTIGEIYDINFIANSMFVSDIPFPIHSKFFKLFKPLFLLREEKINKILE